MAAAAGAGAGAGAGGSSPRQPRRGPAPFASFDHDVSDESSPESKLTFQLPEIREDASPSTSGVLSVPGGGGETEGRARSASTPAVHALQPAPRIDISRASSSSHQDSRDSSPELALFAGAGGDARQQLELGFREDGALDLRSSTEELAFLEGAECGAAQPADSKPRPEPTSVSRRHSRKDSQGSEAALLVVGRTSRLSSVGSQCSALSAYSRVSRLSVVSGASRSPSPHKMLLETSFCGPKPIETDPEVCAAAVEQRLLEIAKLSAELPPVLPAAAGPTVSAPARRDVTAEVTVESVAPRVPHPAPAPAPVAVTATPPHDDDKRLKETRNRARAEERRARSRERRDTSRDQPEVYRTRNKSKDVIRIKLKPDDEDDEDDEEESATARKPASLELRAQPPPRDSRTPSPGPGQHSRKSSFCSLFKSRETIASPESPASAHLRRKKSVNEDRSRSKSRERSATRGSVLSLFRTPRRSAAPSPAPSSRAASPPPVLPSIPPRPEAANLKYYEDTRDGVIHIPLRTPPDEGTSSRCAVRPASAAASGERGATCMPERPATADQPARLAQRPLPKPLTRTVLPDGSIIIPLHSPTEKSPPTGIVSVEIVREASPPRPSTSSSSTTTATKTEDEEPIVKATKEPATSPEPKEPVIKRDVSRLVSPPSPAVVQAASPGDTSPRHRRERLVFTTHVGSREQVFSTQFSITKTPSVTSEMSGSFASFPESSEPELLRDTHIACVEPPPRVPRPVTPVTPAGEPRADSSGSEPSSEAGSTAGGARRGPLTELMVAGGVEDVEKRGLVLGQESFEEELPYVPTTLPLERSMALPMVPVRDRGGGVSVARVERPRPAAAPPAGPPRAPHPAAPPPASEKLRISLPRRPRAASTSAPPRPDRARTRSGSSAGAGGSKGEWIDFEEVPERRKQPKRIQTLPAAAVAGESVVYSYVEPEHCRCECHTAAGAGSTADSRDDELPLLRDTDIKQSPTSPECVHARPFTGDFDLRHDQPARHYDAEGGAGGAGGGGGAGGPGGAGGTARRRH